VRVRALSGASIDLALKRPLRFLPLRVVDEVLFQPRFRRSCCMPALAGVRRTNPRVLWLANPSRTSATAQITASTLFS